MFEHPEFFLLLALVPLMIVGAVLSMRARGRKWRRLVAERLRPLLVRERPPHLRRISFALLLLGFCLLIAALAAPHAGFRESPDLIRGRNILLAVDVSRSMLAGDESPSRLAAARAAALELLDRFPNDRIGVIAFSGVAWLQAPLTIDHAALREVFQQLEFEDSRHEWIPRGGSDLANAVTLAIRTFRETGQRDNALIVLSDGEAHTGDLASAADAAAKAGLTIFTAGFGTDNGGFIPDPDSRDGKLHDREGHLVLTRLEGESLDLLARRTGGFYTKGTGRYFSENLERAVQRLEQYELQGRSRRVAIPRFQWFLVPAMVLFVVGLLLNTSWSSRRRRARAAGIAVVLLGLSPATPADAGLLPRTKAEKALAVGDHERAIALFADEISNAHGERKARLQLGEAAAAYRLGDHRHASQAYSGALLSSDHRVQEEAHFGLGNTQFLKGLALLEGAADGVPNGPVLSATILFWEDAIAHFEATLALAPGHTRARENRAYVQKRLDELRQKNEQEEQAPQQPEPNPQEGGDQAEPDPDNPTPPEDPDASPPPPGEGEGEGDPAPPGEQPPPDPPPNPDPNAEQNPNATGEQPPPPEMNPRPGESPEDYARRVLDENSDFEGRPVPMRIRRIPRPEKDW